MRIIRTILFLTGATVFMPSPPDGVQPAGTQTAATAVNDEGLLVSAAAAAYDVAGFCSRQPGVCRTAGYLATKLEAKAKYNVRLIYEWANDSAQGSELVPVELQAKSDPITTGSSSRLTAAAGDGQGQSTLRLEDLIPEWRGPVLKNKG